MTKPTRSIEASIAFAKFAQADKVWSNELKVLFGKRAGDIRYTKAGEGDAGTKLADLFQRRTIAFKEWEATRKSQ